MTDEEKTAMRWLVGMVMFGLAAAITLVVVAAIMESSTYNRLTGASTTWWDALWVELRIQDEPR